MTTITPGATPPDRRAAFRLLFVCLLLVGAGNTMLISAVLPPLTRALDLADWTAGAIFSFSALIWAVMSAFWGRKSGQWGRRPVISIGMFGFAISMLLFGLFASLGLAGVISDWIVLFPCLLLSRSLFGFIGSATNPAAQAYIADRSLAVNRTTDMASLTAGFTLGTAIGPAIAAALIVWFGLLSPLWIIAALAGGAGFVVLRRLPENRPPQAKGPQVSFGKVLWENPKMRLYLAFGFGLSLFWGVMYQTFPYALMDRMELSGEDASQYIAAAMTIGAMATLMAQLVVIPRLQLPVRSLMLAGMCLLTGAAIVLMTTKLFAVMCLGQLLLGLGNGLARPGFTAGASLAVGPGMQGNVAGMVAATNGAGFVLAPFFGLYAYGHISIYAPFIVSLAGCLGMIAYTLTVLPRQAQDAVLTAEDDDPLP